jgi:flagella basal body P-ring formation protein FlgA
MRAILTAFAAFALIHAVALLAASSAAGAGMPAELVAHPASRGVEIVLSDLFEGVEGPAAQVVVGKGAVPGQSAVLDAGHVQLVAHQAGLEWINARGLRRVIVEGGEPEVPDLAPRPLSTAPKSRTVAATRVRAEPVRTVQALIYARNIPAGETLVADDLIWAEVPAAAHLSDPLGDQDAASGKIARRPLRAGAPAVARDLVGAKVIHRDDIVAVIFRDDGMVLSLQGRALGDAATGEPVQILNLASKKTVEAVASGPGRALAGPEADAIRVAPTRAAPSVYASVR